MIVLIFPASTCAEMQMWVDKAGVKHFSNTGVPQDTEFETSDEIKYDAERADQLQLIRDNKAYEDAEVEQHQLRLKHQEQATAGKELEAQRRTEAKQAAIQQQKNKRYVMEKGRLEDRLKYYQGEYLRGSHTNKSNEYGRKCQKDIREELSKLEKDPDRYFYKKNEEKDIEAVIIPSESQYPQTKFDSRTGTFYYHVGNGNYTNGNTGALNVNQGGGQYFDIQTGKFKRIE